MSGVPDFSRREKAFKLYAQLKNISQVSKELKIPTQTLHNWKKEEHWDDKLDLLRDKLKTQLDLVKKGEDDLIVHKDMEKLNLLDILEQEVAQAITARGLQINSWKDLIATLEFTTKERRLIMGEPTGREINSIEVSFMREEDLDKEIERLERFTKKEEKTDPRDNKSEMGVISSEERESIETV